MDRRILPAIILLILFFIGLLPLSTLLFSPLLKGGSWGIYMEAFTTRNSLNLLGRSIVLSTSVSLLAGAVGTPLGLLLSRTDLPARRLFAAIFTIPLLIPPYANTIAWFDILHKAGLSGILFGFPGVVFVLTFSFYPIVMLLSMAHSRAIESHLEEAALLHAPWFTVIGKITLPLMKFSILLGMALVFLLSMGEIGVPTFLRYPVYPVEILSHFSAFYDFHRAATSSIPLLLIALLLMIPLAGGMDSTPITMKGTSLRIPIEGKWRSILLTIIATGAFLVLLPYAALLHSMGTGNPGEVLQIAGDSLLRSIALAGTGATIITALGFIMGYVIARRFPMSGWIQAIVLLLFALPGAVMGVGIIGLWNRPITEWFYASPLIILMGYVARYIVLGVVASTAGIAMIPSSLEEAATLHGAGTARILTGILMPLTGRFLIAGWFLSFVFCFRDFDTTFLLQPAGWDTLPVLLFTYMANGEPRTVAGIAGIMAVSSLTVAAAGLITTGFLRQWRT